MCYEPRNLRRWTRPNNYVGEIWPDYYSSGFGQSRDSDALERSNFSVALEALGGETETVLVIREGHWAVGWVEWIAIHYTNAKALEIADDLCGRHDDYPVLDEEHFSDLEWNECASYWNGLSPRDKVQMAIDERSRRNWLQKEPVWRFGRMTYGDLANDGSTIAEALYQSLRDI